MKNQFRFISISNPEESKDRETRRQARSHAVRHALQQRKRMRQGKAPNIGGPAAPSAIIAAPSNDDENPSTRSSDLLVGISETAVRSEQAGSQSALIVSSRVPVTFETTISPTLRVEPDLDGSNRLKALFSNSQAVQGAEPVFSVAEADEVVFQTFERVFRSGMNDPALLNAVMFTFAFAVTKGHMNQECINYQTLALQSIREKMKSPDTSIAISSIGAILLLAGVEARLGMRPTVEMHMKAIRKLLEICRERGVYLTDGIKRAIFWQDLNASVLSGSERVVSHTTFSEMNWKRDVFCLDKAALAPGFYSLRNRDLLSDEFAEVLKDIHSLQCIRDDPAFSCDDTVTLLHVDNHQAWINSRLLDLPKSPASPILECTRLAAYMCACMLCCKVWKTSVIPPHVSAQLLQKLKETIAEQEWEDHEDLLIWLIYMGGSFAHRGFIRSEYVVLLHQKEHSFGRRSTSWKPLEGLLKQFIWSERALKPSVRDFWDEIRVPSSAESVSTVGRIVEV